MMHETRHHLFQLFLPHLAMRNAQSSVRANPSDEIGERVNRFDTVMDHVHLSTSLQLETDRIFDDHGLEFQTTVWMASRSRGAVSITDMSRKPLSAMFSVRGI